MSTPALDAMRRAAVALRDAGVVEAEREAELLVTKGLGMERLSLYRDEPLLNTEQQERLNGMLARRVRREPVHYILGSVEFYGLEISVGPGVLVPRPETELLVQVAVRLLRNNPAPKVLEIGAGSGCVALALAHEMPNSKIMATDTSDTALEYSNRNAQELGIKNARFLRGELFGSVADERFDALVSNPPYVPTAEIGGLMPEVRDWEPREALDGGPDGLDYYRSMVPSAPAHLGPGGFLVLEIGHSQAKKVREIAQKAGLEAVETIRDTAGHERILAFALPDDG